MTYLKLVGFFFSFSVSQVEHLLLWSMMISFSDTMLISLLFARSLYGLGVKVNINLTGLLGCQHLNMFDGNSG